MTFRGIIIGLVVIIIIFAAGFWYRTSIEHPQQQITCPLDTETCPDGSTVSRIGSACTFPVCPPPNVTLDAGISYAVPDNYASITSPSDSGIAAYQYAATSTATSSTISEITIRQYALNASTTALSVINNTALSATSGQPVPPPSFTSTVIDTHRFTVVPIERFEGVVDMAYYLAYKDSVFRFDAIDTNVANWENPSLDVSSLPAEQGLIYLLSTIQ